MNEREKLPKWDQLWSDLVHEEFWQNTRDGSSSKTDAEDNCALVGKAKKGKWKASHSKSESSKAGQKRDFSNVKDRKSVV